MYLGTLLGAFWYCKTASSKIFQEIAFPNFASTRLYFSVPFLCSVSFLELIVG